MYLFPNGYMIRQKLKQEFEVKQNINPMSMKDVCLFVSMELTGQSAWLERGPDGFVTSSRESMLTLDSAMPFSL